MYGTKVVSGPVTFVRFIEHSPHFVVAERVSMWSTLKTKRTKVGVWAYGTAYYVTKAGKWFESQYTRDVWRGKVMNTWDTRDKVER